MRLSVGILIALAACLAAFSFVKFSKSSDTQMSVEYSHAFEKWTKLHKRSYSCLKEKLHRFGIFSKKLAQVKLHNSQKRSWTVGLNLFSDMDILEVKAKYFGVFTIIHTLPKFNGCT